MSFLAFILSVGAILGLIIFVDRYEGEKNRERDKNE
jgi:hypothetical protein